MKLKVTDDFVELYFDGKPDKEIRDVLKANNWRWFPPKGCWSVYRTTESEAFARSFVATNELISVTDRLDNRVLKKLNNRAGSREYSVDDFLDLADWDNCESHSGKAKDIYETKTGRLIEVDSDSERKLLNYLDQNGLTIEIGGQAMQLTYQSDFAKNKKYSPDIVCLTKDNRIAIFEVKPVSAMDYHLNIDKYNALKKYCEINGFEYVMIDPDFDYMTYEELVDMPVDSILYELFMELHDRKDTKLNPYKHFTDENVNAWYKEIGCKKTKGEFKLQVHSLVAWAGWYNVYKNGFDVYSRPVKFNEYHEVISYIGDESLW